MSVGSRAPLLLDRNWTPSDLPLPIKHDSPSLLRHCCLVACRCFLVATLVAALLSLRLPTMPRPKGTGRRKVEMRKISDPNAALVTFSKRKHGLFKKAAELSAMCGAQTAVVAFSPAGKPYTFGHPSADAVLDRYLRGGVAAGDLGFTAAPEIYTGSTAWPSQSGEEDVGWPDLPAAPVEGIGMEELLQREREILELKSQVERRLQAIICSVAAVNPAAAANLLVPIS